MFRLRERFHTLNILSAAKDPSFEGDWVRNGRVCRRAVRAGDTGGVLDLGRDLLFHPAHPRGSGGVDRLAECDAGAGGGAAPSVRTGPAAGSAVLDLGWADGAGRFRNGLREPAADLAPDLDTVAGDTGAGARGDGRDARDRRTARDRQRRSAVPPA